MAQIDELREQFAKKYPCKHECTGTDENPEAAEEMLMMSEEGIKLYNEAVKHNLGPI